MVEGDVKKDERAPGGFEIQVKGFKVLGLEGFIDDPRFATGEKVIENREALLTAMDERIATKTRDEWMALFAKVDACVEPVLALGEALADPHVSARGLVVEVDLPGEGTVRQLGHPIRYSATPPEYRSAGAPAGTHTREVLRELGYTDAEIEKFEKTGLFK